MELGSKRYYRMTERVFSRVKNLEGKPPACVYCGRVLKVGDLVLSKPSGSGRNTIRYCDDCRKELRIWVDDSY